MRILLLLSVLLAGCSTQFEVVQMNELEYRTIPCKFEIQGELDTLNYQYSASVWTIEESPVSLKASKINNIKLNKFVAYVPSTGVAVSLVAYDKKTMLPVGISDTEYNYELVAYDCGDGTDEEIYILNILE